MQSEKMFELADQLRELRETKQFAEQELKEINAEKAEGFGELVQETVNSNSLSAFVKEQITENGDVLPDWLNGLVNIYEKTTVGVRKAAK